MECAVLRAGHLNHHSTQILRRQPKLYTLCAGFQIRFKLSGQLGVHGRGLCIHHISLAYLDRHGLHILEKRSGLLLRSCIQLERVIRLRLCRTAAPPLFRLLHAVGRLDGAAHLGVGPDLSLRRSLGLPGLLRFGIHPDLSKACLSGLLLGVNGLRHHFLNLSSRKRHRSHCSFLLRQDLLRHDLGLDRRSGQRCHGSRHLLAQLLVSGVLLPRRTRCLRDTIGRLCGSILIFLRHELAEFSTVGRSRILSHGLCRFAG